MNKFSDFNIKQNEDYFIGNKINIQNILNKEITIYKYRLMDSKYNKNKCLELQISLNDIKYILFTGSKNLIDAINQVQEDMFPFSTTIIKSNNMLMFS